MQKTSVFINAEQNVSQAFDKMSKSVSSLSTDFVNLKVRLTELTKDLVKNDKSLKDNQSSLKKATEESKKNAKTVEDNAKSIDKKSTAIKKNNKEIKEGTKNVKSLSDNSSKLTAGLMRAGVAIAALAAGFASISKTYSGLKDFFETGLKVNADTQTAEIGIAGLYASLIKFKDENGNLIVGGDKFSKSIELARKDVRLLLQDALNTSASFSEVKDGYIAALSPGLSAGMSRTQIRELSTLTANTANTMGLQKGSLPQEMRALLSGEVTSDATIATAMGLGSGGALKAEYDEAVKLGKQYEFLITKMSEFKRAGEEQAKTLKGNWDAAQEIFEQFAGEASKALEEELLNIAKPLEGIFDNGEWSKDLDGLLALLQRIGGYVGETMSDAFSYVMNIVKDIGSYLEENSTVLIVMEEAAEVFRQVLFGVFEIIFEIFKLSADVVGVFMGFLGVSRETTDQMSSMEKALLKIHLVINTIRVAFAAVKDVVLLLVDVIRGTLAVAIEMVMGVFSGFLNRISKTLEFFSFESTAKSAKDLSAELAVISSSFSNQIAGNSNKALSVIGSGGAKALKEVFAETAQALSEFDKRNAEFEKSSSNSFVAQLEKIRKAREEAQKKASEKEKGSEEAGNKNNNAKKGAGGKVEDVQKLAYENELNDLKSFAEEKKYIIDNMTRFLELDRSHNLISLNDYYSQKRKLEEEDYNNQLDLVNKQIAITQEQKKNAKNKKDLNKLEATENQLIVQRTKIIEDLEFKQKSFELESAKALKDYGNELRNLDFQILEMTGGKYDAIKLRLEVERVEMLDKYKTDAEATEKVNKLFDLKDVESKVSTSQLKISDIVEMQALKEEALSIQKEARYISELEYLSQIEVIRRNNISQLEEELRKIQDLINSGNENLELLKTMQQVTNEIEKMKMSVAPLATELNDLFKTSLSDNLTEVLSNTKSLKDGFNDLFNTLHQRLLKLAVDESLNSLTNKLTGGSGGFGGFMSGLIQGDKSGVDGIFSSIFGGARASGGTMKAGLAYRFNEAGDEWIVPRVDAFAVNSPKASYLSNSMGSGQTIVQNINVTSKDYNSFRNSDNQIASQMYSALQRGLRNM